ncbi:zf-HC2 domain-containing protein [Proteiniborus sp.]|uniref:zf-HC2 domain-containing protein n=1 Tax=Proteiniborus sp. TaxID=2079015 RepID=UPI003326ACB5
MECKEVLSKVDKYFESRLSDIEKYNIKKHLERCSKCKQEYEDMSFTFSILDSHYVDAPDDLADKIMMKISSFENSKKRSTKVLRNLGASFVAAGIMITLLNFSNYNPKILARGLFRSAFEINQVVTNPITKLTESLRYVSDLYINDSNK